jgi:hypothetical protein
MLKVGGEQAPVMEEEVGGGLLRQLDGMWGVVGGCAGWTAASIRR